MVPADGLEQVELHSPLDTHLLVLVRAVGLGAEARVLDLAPPGVDVGRGGVEGEGCCSAWVRGGHRQRVDGELCAPGSQVQVLHAVPQFLLLLVEVTDQGPPHPCAHRLRSLPHAQNCGTPRAVARSSR